MRRREGAASFDSPRPVCHHGTNRPGFPSPQSPAFREPPRRPPRPRKRMAPVSTADPRRAVEGDDQVVIADCLAGKTAAFGALVGRYQDRLYNTVFRLVDNAEDALDVVQEAFLHAYQSLESFKGDSQFFTWLYRIAVNTAISHKRKRRARRRLDGRDGEALDPLDPSADSRPGHALEQAEQEQRVHRALARL